MVHVIETASLPDVDVQMVWSEMEAIAFLETNVLTEVRLINKMRVI